MTTTASDTVQRLREDPDWAIKIGLDQYDPSVRFYASDERTVSRVSMKLAGCRKPGQPLDAGLQLAATDDDFLTPQQAREVARHLLELADTLEGTLAP